MKLRTATVGALLAPTLTLAPAGVAAAAPADAPAPIGITWEQTDHRNDWDRRDHRDRRDHDRGWERNRWGPPAPCWWFGPWLVCAPWR